SIWLWWNASQGRLPNLRSMRPAITSSSARRPAASRRPVGVARICLALVTWWLPLAAQQEKPEKPPPEKLEPVKTSITVAGQIAVETPSNISVLDRDRIAATPGTELDDRLRTIPGFSLFRRTSSLVAHPTTQGVSLRGLGSSGASRSLVLWDGIPINDPFG